MKTDFKKFPVGTVFNPIVRKINRIDPSHKSIEVHYPSRLEAMALDPSKIANNNNLIYTAGQIDFSVGIFKHITVKILADSSEIVISETTKRKPLVRHAAEIMRSALGTIDGLEIDVKSDLELRHCGLGSSSSLVAGTAAAINELYGKLLTPLELSRYCAQNHGEEIDGDDGHLMPVQCIGGSAICGHYEGGLIILSGEATPILQYKLSHDLKVVIGIPENFRHPDSENLMEAEIDNMDGFVKTGEQYGKEIAYRLVHEVMPGLKNNNLKPCKDLIFDYRWDMGSITNCSFVYPRMLEVAENLRFLKDDKKVEIISLSSVGPGFFAVTSQPEYVEKIFKKQKLHVYIINIHNNSYKVKKHS